MQKVLTYAAFLVAHTKLISNDNPRLDDSEATTSK